MWFFDWFKTQFGNIEEKFDDIAEDIDGVPVLGNYLARPFRSMATFFRNLERASGSASDWVDEIIRDVSDLTSNMLNWIKELWDETDLLWKRIGAIPVLTKDVIIGWVEPLIDIVKIYAENLINNTIEVFDNLVTDINNRIDLLQVWMESLPGILNEHLDNSKDKILGWIEDSLITIIEKVMEHEKKE